MFDLISLYEGKYEKTFTGTYYSVLPLTTENAGVKFDYEITEQCERKNQTVLGNIAVQSKTVTVKTNDVLDFKIKGYVALDDGSFYVIESIKEDTEKATEEAKRFLNSMVCTEYELKLSEHDNPWGMK